MLVNGKQGNLISIRDRGLLYGDGVFRTILAGQGKAQHWPLHYQKIKNDCAALGIVCPELPLLTAELDALLTHHQDGVVKLIVTRGQSARGFAPVPQTIPTHIWDISPLPGYPADKMKFGIQARLCQLRLSQQPRLAGIKHLNRLENVLAAAESHEADEGLLMDTDGNVIEGTRSNLFLVVHGMLVTPDLSRCGVAGVQRDRVMSWAYRYNMPLQVRDVSLDDVMNADEIFLVNSVIKLWPVRELAHKCWAEFPVAERIRQILEEQNP
jgi:4-amino-4-deoxychorismate lyase